MKGASVTEFDGAFGLIGLIAAGLDVSEQFVGSMTIDVQVDEKGENLLFILSNTTSATSAAYHAWDSYTRDEEPRGGNMNQVIFLKSQLQMPGFYQRSVEMKDLSSQNRQANCMKYWTAIFMVFLMSCITDMVYEREIVKGYYLIAIDDSKQLKISRKLETGDYIGRIPKKVQKYAVVNDTLIFARTTNGYYVLNTAHDHDFAEVKDVVIGPVDQATFNRDWSSKYNIKFRLPK